MKERVIRVTGKGQIKAKPDMTRITLTLEEGHREYDKTLEASREAAEALRDILEQQDFERTALKTVSFNIDTKHESYRETDGSWQSKFVGYVCRHIMKVELDSDNDRLGRLLYALANGRAVHPQFRISYFVKDPEAVKNELLGRAVKDARAKAEALTAAAGVALKDIVSIDYSWGKMEFEVHTVERCGEPMEGMARTCEAEAYDLHIQPEDVEVNDTVTVVWEIG